MQMGAFNIHNVTLKNHPVEKRINCSLSGQHCMCIWPRWLGVNLGMHSQGLPSASLVEAILTSSPGAVKLLHLQDLGLMGIIGKKCSACCLERHVPLYVTFVQKADVLVCQM